MTDIQADPKRTYALVVGIEHYDTDENWDLKTDESWNLIGPAHDARRFVEWLRSRGVPAENISLFLAPLDRVLKAGNISAQAAYSDLIQHAITTTLPAKQGDLLYVFWSGRSIHTAESEHRLLYIDVNEQGRQNLNPNTLLSMLHSNKFAQLPRQIFIFDTYTHTVKKRNRLAIAPTTTLAPELTLPSIHQFVLFAASRPTTSMSSPRLFSDEVLEQLAVAQTSLLPDMDALARQLHERFQEMRGTRTTARIINYDYIDWDGKRHEHSYDAKRGRQGQDERGNTKKDDANDNSKIIYEKQRRLQKLREQEARHGMDTPPAITLEIEDLEAEIEQLQTISSISTIIAQPQATVEHVWHPTFQQKNELVNSLLVCHTIRNRSSRDAVLRQLDPDVANRIIDDSQPNVHVLNIIDTCLSFAGGMEKLVTILRAFEGASAQMKAVEATLERIFPGFLKN